MPWNERSRMDKRLVLIGEYLKGERPMTELCVSLGSVGRAPTNGWRATKRKVRAGSRIVPAPRIRTRATNVARWWGFANTFDLDSATDVLMIGVHTAVSATNLSVWARVGGVGSPSDSGVARPSGVTMFTFARAANGTVRLVMGDSTALGSFAAGSLPTTAALNFGFAVRNRTNATRTMTHYAFLALNPAAITDTLLIES